jgi:hypothetical protein
MISKFIKLLERLLKDKTYSSIEINRREAVALLATLRGEIPRTADVKVVKRQGRPRTRPAKIKKTRTYKQKRSDVIHAENMNDAIEKGTNHIIGQIKNKYMTAQEFLNDPSVYYDSQVMGKYKNIPAITKSIENNVFSKYFF